jgi:preprotein translocase subunit SecE
MTAKQERIAPTTLGLMKYVHVMFFTGAVVFGWLLTKTFETIWTSLNLSIAAVPPPNEWISLGVGAAFGVGIALYLWRNDQVNRLSVEIVTELSKVTWPTRKELYASTIVVIIFSVIAAVILGLFDFFWAWATDLVYL